MGKRNKQVKHGGGTIPAPTKTPKADFSTNFHSLRPAWRVSLLEMCAPFGWHEIPKDKLKEICEKLANFESRTWNEILVVSKKQNHTIPIEDLSKEAKARLEELKLDDVDEVVSLHLSGKERVFGIRQDIALTLLWWDPDHKVCPSILKHT